MFWHTGLQLGVLGINNTHPNSCDHTRSNTVHRKFAWVCFFYLFIWYGKTFHIINKPVNLQKEERARMSNANDCTCVHQGHENTLYCERMRTKFKTKEHYEKCENIIFAKLRQRSIV